MSNVTIREKSKITGLTATGRKRSPVEQNPIYGSWCEMRRRCYSPQRHNYKYYGGKGIKVCDRWLGIDGFKNFCKDMGNKPTEQHSLDRIDNTKDYGPENCRWADKQTQAMNRKQRTGKYPKGITKNVSGNFAVAFRRAGKLNYLGTYKTLNEAINVARKTEAKL